MRVISEMQSSLTLPTQSPLMCVSYYQSTFIKSKKHQQYIIIR